MTLFCFFIFQISFLWGFVRQGVSGEGLGLLIVYIIILSAWKVNGLLFNWHPGGSLSDLNLQMFEIEAASEMGPLRF